MSSRDAGERVQPRGRVGGVTGQRVTILCTDGEFVIETPLVHGVSVAAITKPLGWVFEWTPTPVPCGERFAWRESVSRLVAIRGVERLRRTMKLLTEQKPEGALQEAAGLLDPYLPVWALLQAEASRRGLPLRAD
jgi:hypothetical protein